MTVHPEGPRTLWTQLRDNLPLPAGAIARGLELEHGRHPTLTELREAFGLDLNLRDAWEAGRQVQLDRDETPPDAQLAHYLDDMYRRLTSPRVVRVRVSDGELAASRDEQPIRLRDGERLIVLVLVDNEKDRNVEYSAQLVRQESRGRVEAGRTASCLLDGGLVSGEARRVELNVACDGRTAVQEIAIDVIPSWTLSVEIFDDETDLAVAARIYLTDDVGPVRPPGATLRRDEHGNAFFHADGSFEARISGQVRLVASRGMEYEQAELTIVSPPEGNHSVTVRMKRWSHMAAEGWRSGDVHVHLHYGGEYLLSPDDASLVQRGEDVHFMNMMVANQGSAFVHDRAYFEGRPNELSDDEHILRWGEEYRNDFYGHLCMYGISELVPPIYSGFLLSEHADDSPANYVAAEHCHNVGGTLSYAHPLFGSTDPDRVFAVPRTVEAKELPVDIALGTIDALDIMSYPGSYLDTADLWYRLLNCGFRLAATAGTDTFMNFAGLGRFSNPPAGNRVFAQVDGAFTTEAWCESVRRGRTFVTNGPMLRLNVNGSGIGSELDLDAGSTLTIHAGATSYAPMEQIELIVNGENVARGEVSEDGRSATLVHDLAASASCWVALRALGPEHPAVLGGELFAHTSPVYVTVAGASVNDQAAASYFVEWIDRLIAMCHEHGRYSSNTQRDEVVGLFRTAQEHYRRLARE